MATLHMQLHFPVTKDPLGPSDSTICWPTAPKRPRKSPTTLCTLAGNSPKRTTDHILGYMAPNELLSAPNPHGTTNFWWFPPLETALTDA